MEKPFGIKAYNSIGHLPNSRLGSGDHSIDEKQARILTEQTRDKHDLIIVQEKVDGSNVAVGKLGGVIIPITRSGYRAESSSYKQHQMFATWVAKNWTRFNTMLAEGERLSGEWLAMAHGTRYTLSHEPFVAFDLFRDNKRVLWEELKARCQEMEITNPALLHIGGACSVKTAMEALGEHGHHGALDPAEGAVWRCERKGQVVSLAKYVRPTKVDGLYLPKLHGSDPIWHYTG